MGSMFGSGMSSSEKREVKLGKMYAGASLPDEEVIKRNERRKAAKRRGTRVRNVLTDEDAL